MKWVQAVNRASKKLRITIVDAFWAVHAVKLAHLNDLPLLGQHYEKIWRRCIIENITSISIRTEETLSPDYSYICIAYNDLLYTPNKVCVDWFVCRQKFPSI